MRKTLLIGGLVLLAVAGGLVGHLASTHASNTSQTFTATADAYVSAEKPTTNYGRATQLVVDGLPVRRAYLRFTVANLPGPLTHATLRVYAASSSHSSVAVSRVATTDWAEQSITWSNAPAIQSPSIASPSSFSPGWVTIDVSTLVTGEGVVSLAITEQGSTAVSLRSRESGAGSAPQLVVEADTSGTASGGTSTTTATGTTVPATTTASTPATTATPPPTTTMDTGPPTTTLATVPPPTTSSDGASPVIAAAGDIACNSAPATAGTSCQQRLTAALLGAEPSLSAVLTLGDIQYECGDYSNLLKYYDPTWGQFRALTHPAIGNHEYLTAPGSTGCDPATTVPGQGYFDYWNGVGAESGPAGDRTTGYYSYDVGSWHLIALNSNCAQVGGCTATSPQGTWLRNDLAAHPSACTLAYWHHPRFSSGEHGDNTSVSALWDALYSAGADVVLNGHDHDYERFAPQTPAGAADPTSGIREFVVGTGGRSHYAFPGAIQPNSEARNADTFGVLELTLRPQGYDWRFLPVQGGSFTDSGSGACH